MPDIDRMDSLKQRIARLDTAITVTVASPDPSSPAARATHDLLEQLLDEVSTVSVVSTSGESEGVVVTLSRDHARGPVSFWGTPSGFELEGFTYALECFGGLVVPTLGDQERQVLAQIQTPISADLYVAPT